MGVVRVEYMWCAATGSRLPAWRSAGGECEAARAHDLSLLRTVFPRQQLHKPPDDGVRLMSRGPLLICLAGEGKAAGEGSHLRAVDFVVLGTGRGGRFLPVTRARCGSFHHGWILATNCIQDCGIRSVYPGW
jgi:hypothetical protein